MVSSKIAAPFRAEHVGSLVRPESLSPEKLGALFANPELLVKTEDEAIRDIVQVQKDCGLYCINDGEFRRRVFWGTLFQTFEGMESLFEMDVDQVRSYAAGFVRHAGKIQPGMFMKCTGKLKHSGRSDYVKEVEFLKTLLPEEQWAGIKVTLPTPNWYHLTWKDGFAFSKEVYASDAEYFQDLAACYRKELELLYAAGLRNIQFDDPNFTFFCSPDERKDWDSDSANTKSFDDAFLAYIDLYNLILEGKPADLHCGIHLCRGNFKQSDRSGGYDAIAEPLFQKLKLETFYLEFDNERSGSFDCLVNLPKGKNVILGVVTTKDEQLEDVEAIKSRVETAAQFIAKGNGSTEEAALKQIGLSPQCGFSSIISAPNMNRDHMVRKLKHVRKIADEIWPEEY